MVGHGLLAQIARSQFPDGSRDLRRCHANSQVATFLVANQKSTTLISLMSRLAKWVLSIRRPCQTTPILMFTRQLILSRLRKEQGTAPSLSTKSCRGQSTMIPEHRGSCKRHPACPSSCVAKPLMDAIVALVLQNPTRLQSLCVFADRLTATGP